MLFVIIVDKVELKTTTARVKVAGKVQFYLSVQAMVKTGENQAYRQTNPTRGRPGVKVQKQAGWSRTGRSARTEYGTLESLTKTHKTI